MYQGLNDVPWFAAMGNHDLGDSDLYATCPEKAPRVIINGQAYASNQLDSDKGGYRPSSVKNADNFHMPDFSYRMTLDALNFELFALDQNYGDVSGIGGNPGTHVLVDSTCGGGDMALGKRLEAIGHSGEELLALSAAKGAKDPFQTRDVLVIQHYQDTCASLKYKFSNSMPVGESLDFRCTFGHVHNTTCESGTDENCEFSMTGGGGGCCFNDVVNSQAGFGLLTFNPSGGMNVELIRLGKNCTLQPQ